MVMMMLMALMVVMMVVVVSTAFMFMVMTVVMIVTLVFVFMLMVMLMTFMLVLMVMVMMMVVVMLFVMVGLLCRETGQFLLERVLVLHGFQDGLAVQLLPWGRDDRSILVVFPEKLDRIHELLFTHTAGAAENNGGSVFDLIVEKLTKILHIDLTLAGIRYGDERIELDIMAVHPLHRTDHVRKLAHTRRLNEDAVRLELNKHLLQSLSKVPHQTAADTAGIHFRDLYSGILKEAAINADLAEFILNQDQLLSLVCFLDEFLDKGRLASA